MVRTLDNMQDVIDSRDIIARIEELQNDGANERRIEHPDLPPMNDEDAETLAELDALRKLADEADCSPDWKYGETLIRESYFVDYIEELINDCYSLPKEMTSGEWPWRHVTIDYEAAAQEAKADYIDVDFDGVTYYIRG